DGRSGAEGERDLGERAELAVDGDDDVGGPHDDGVASLAEAGGDGDVHVLVGGTSVARRQDPDRRAALGLGALAGSLHYAAEPAAHNDSTAPRQLPPDRLCDRRGIGAGLTASDYGDVRSN